MEPALSLGSAAVTKPTSPFALDIGDIISVHDADDGSATLHRIVDIRTVNGERQFITQGDQNRTPDVEPVVLTGFGDKVVYSVPYAGHLLNIARSWFGRLLLLGIPALFVAVTFASRLRSSWPWWRSKAATQAPVADGEGSLTTAIAGSETPPVTEDATVANDAAPEAQPVADAEPVANDAAPEALPVADTQPIANDAAPEALPVADAEPVANDAAPEALPVADAEPIANDVAPEAQPVADAPVADDPEAQPVADAEPVANDAALPETLPTSIIKPVEIAATQPEIPANVPDSPFPIEAALEAKAKEESGATPRKKPALRIVSSSDSDDKLPAFLADQMTRRHSVGDHADDQREAGEESVA